MRVDLFTDLLLIILFEQETGSQFTLMQMSLSYVAGLLL